MDLLKMRGTWWLCAAVHCLVDFACAFLLFRQFRGGTDWASQLVAYNFCAFALQMPLGVLADRWRRDLPLAAVGCAFVGAAYLGLPAWPAVILAGVGNACFHVGAGLAVLHTSKERAGPLGLFVSPGALGLYAGTLLGGGEVLPGWIPAAAMLASAAGLLAIRQGAGEARSGSAETASGKILLPVAALLAVVVLRSYVGMQLTFPWKAEWAAALTVALALGKAAGGYLADRFGAVQTAAASLGLCAALLLAGESPLCGVAAVFLFNMTMPLTLWAAARLLPGNRGFAFGLLTFGLFLGFLPGAFGWPGLAAPAAGVWALASLAVLAPALGKAVRRT